MPPKFLSNVINEKAPLIAGFKKILPIFSPIKSDLIFVKNVLAWFWWAQLSLSGYCERKRGQKRDKVSEDAVLPPFLYPPCSWIAHRGLSQS